MLQLTTCRQLAVSLVLAALVVGIGLTAGPAAGMPGTAPAAYDPPPISFLADLSQADPLTKLEGGLKELALGAAPKRVATIIVMSTGPVDLSAYGDVMNSFTWPAGEHVSILQAAAGDLLAIAALPGVYAVDWGDPEAAVARPQVDGLKANSTLPPAEMRARLDAAPRWPETAARLARNAPDNTRPDFTALARDPAGEQPDGWYDVDQGHAAREAWDMGFTGEGVTVAVLDDAIDFAHQDLQGTWKVLPEGHPYAGWPQAFDPYAGYQRALDAGRAEEAQSIRTAVGGMIELYQTSTVEQREIGGQLVDTACFQPLQNLGTTQPRVLGAEACDYIVPPSMGGQVRFGHHPETALMGFGADAAAGLAGEWAGVLLVDANEPGVFDTIYVDVNSDHDFTDEKPTTQADPLSWRDINGDAIADLSGGLLYYISDGEVPFPGNYLWGLADEVFPPGQLVGILYIAGSHGTMCASNVVSQGRLGVPADLNLEFRDLPGDHEPASVNLGMAPKAKIVSIGDVYLGGRILFETSWRYAVLGHDPDRTDDQIQVTSNSYGFSDIDNDGWEDSARLVDYYVRHFSPETSFLFSTGNGAPGYGTLAPPSPSVAMGIAASTQMGSTGMDSITDTLQITFGDIIPFSNRGPGADGRNGPTLAADGAYATGAIPINGVTASGGNGAYANTTWGGTSRSSPVANGGLALVYGAFHQANDRFPTWEEARALVMAGARYAGYDTFTMGAGVLDAADAARIAAGLNGVYAIPPEWTAGGYRGEKYPAFAKVLSPGEADTQTVTLHNPADEPLEVTLSGQTLRRIGSYETALTTDLLQESPSGAVPDYLVPIDLEQIPAGTELMVVRGIFPMSEFDLGSDITADNGFSLGVMQHTDINGDGQLWQDGDGNGVVGHREMLDSYVAFNWDDQTREHDSYEGAITVPLEPDGLESEIAYYGRGCNDDPREQDVNEKLALIARGTCTFAEKFLNAQSDGAIGAVVFTDERAKVVMGGDATGVTIPGVMIDRQPGLDLVAVLQPPEGQGAVVTALMKPRQFTGKGIDGAPPVIYPDSEIDQYEYMRITQDGSSHNNWAASVHHPRERWSDGLYISLWHSVRNAEVPNTHVRFRLDFYAYQDWDLLSLSDDVVTVPAGGTVDVGATLTLPADVPSGGYQGAIFADYARGAGDEPVKAPGGYEIAQQRVVIPVNVNVAPIYDWQGTLSFGGAAANDLDAPYGNGAVRGAFNWNWRNESGDWRFFFLDATEPDINTYWLFRTRWDDENLGQADIDTRVWGPLDDQFSDPDDRRNAESDFSDPAWYGPYTLGPLTRSAYVYLGGGRWSYQTSSGQHDDWLAAPAGGGLHEVMLDNILFSGTEFELPFETLVGSLQVGSAPLPLFGAACGQLEIRSQMDLPDLQVRGFGMSLPVVIDDHEISQDDPNDRTTSSFKQDVAVASEAGRFVVTLHGEDDDDLDLIVLYDADGDGTFAYPAESVGEGTSEVANEVVALPGFRPAGAYQVWVHGWQVAGEDSRFDLEIEVVSGDTIQVNDVPDAIAVGETAALEVCADQAALAGADGPAYGIVVFGPGGAPTLMQVPVEWRQAKPTIFLPLAPHNFELGPEPVVP